MASITADLREYADWLHGRAIIDDEDHMVLDGIAYAIDADHERRMEQCRRETMRRCLHRVRSMTSDMERGIKWTRKERQ